MKESASRSAQSNRKRRKVPTAPGPSRRRRQREPGEPKGLKSIDKSTCYLNSVLQCLTYTAPFAEYCQRELHSTSCTRGEAGNCTFCILEEQIRLQLSYIDPQPGNPVKLYEHITESKSELFQRERHEDAHELLSFLIDNCGNGLQVMTELSTSTNEQKPFLEELFSGSLQGRIQCGQCGARSTKQEEMLGLSIDVEESKSLAHAVSCYFRSEVLDAENKVQCSGCNSLSAARKRMSIHKMPKILNIQLQRFNPLSTRKLTKHVRFEERLSVARHMSKKFTEAPEPDYALYGVISHYGKIQSSGHYIAYVKGTNGKWYSCNDSNVREVREEEILKLGRIASNAYLLFYIRSDVDTTAI